MKKRILSLLLVLLMVVSLVPTAAMAEDDVVAYEVTGGNIYFDKTTGTVTSCDPEVTEANIPSEIDGVKVTGIWGFAHCENLESVKIPNSVKNIYDCTFEDCENLANVTISNGVISIGASAFCLCKSLRSITIPDSVTSIGSYAFESTGLTSVMIPESVTSIGYISFASCESLTDIKVADENTAYCSVNGVLFNKDITEIIQYPAGKADSYYAIPESVRSIVWSAFSGCERLANIEIPDGVTDIGNSAFSNCKNLKNITIPDSVTSIEISAFLNCESLTSVAISNKVTSIGWCTFFRCTALTSVTIPNSVTYIDSHAFGGCTSLKSIKIPDSVTSISRDAFYDCQSLTNIYYTGTEEQWNAINILDGNEALLNATIHYNYHEHVTELAGAKASTCTEDGYTGDEVCTICGETIKEGEVIPATGHHFKGNTCPDCGETRSTADTIRAWFQESFNNMKNFFDKIFGRN